MVTLIVVAIIALNPSPNLLNQTTERYSRAVGFQWVMESTVKSPAFDETETTPVEFIYGSPDTFYYKSANEEVIGVADTVWIMSKKHHQIQKKLMEEYTNPADFIFKWNKRYDLIGSSESKNEVEFNLKGHNGINPPDLKLTIDNKARLRKLSYTDSSGNDVVLVIKNERLLRAKKINVFYENPPSGYKLIDLTE